jgi:tetratricopeptide (TPR) repeat protein
MVVPQIIVQGLPLAVSAGRYLGLIKEELAAKLDKLAGSELQAGMRALEQAIDSEQERQSLLREARSRFNKAVNIECGLRLALAHLGSALCHLYLGDRINAKRALKELLVITPPSLPIGLRIAEKVAKAPRWVKVLVPGNISLDKERTFVDWLIQTHKQEIIMQQTMLAALQASAEDSLTQL